MGTSMRLMAHGGLCQIKDWPSNADGFTAGLRAVGWRSL